MAAVALGGGNLAVAQEGAALSRGLVLEEITVTAQRREERLLEVPLSITVFDGQTLERDSAASLHDISGQTPGLVFTAFSVGQPEISIRGVSTKEDGASANDSTVVSIDDVYIAARTAQVFDISTWSALRCCAGRKAPCTAKTPSAAPSTSSP